MSRYIGQFRALGGKLPYVIVAFTDALVFVQSSGASTGAQIALRLAGALVDADDPAETLADALDRVVGTEGKYRLARQRAYVTDPFISSTQFLSSVDGAYAVSIANIASCDVKDERDGSVLRVTAKTRQARWLGNKSSWPIERGDEHIARAVTSTLASHPPDVRRDAASGKVSVVLTDEDEDIREAVVTDKSGNTTLDLRKLAEMKMSVGNLLSAADIYGLLGANWQSEQLSDDSIHDTLTSLRNQAFLLSELGRDPESFSVLQQAYFLCSKTSDDLVVIDMLAALLATMALCCERLGDEETAFGVLDMVFDIYTQMSQRDRDMPLLPMATHSESGSAGPGYESGMRDFSLSEISADAMVHKSVMLGRRPKENRAKLLDHWRRVRDAFGSSSLPDVQLSVGKCIVHEAAFYDLDGDHAAGNCQMLWIWQ